MRHERREAKQAIDSARAVEDEVRRMAKRLPAGSRSRSRLESAVRFAEAELSVAEAGRRDVPDLAARRAERAAARLDRASIRFGPRSGAGAGRSDRKRLAGADAAVRAKARVELVKRRRKQAEQARKMAKKVAALTIGQAIVVPNEPDAPNAGERVSRRAGAPRRDRR